MKQPKAEWEGVIIRNSNAKCNNRLPTRGGTIPEENCANAVSKCFCYMRNIVKTEQSKFKLIAN